MGNVEAFIKVCAGCPRRTAAAPAKWSSTSSKPSPPTSAHVRHSNLHGTARALGTPHKIEAGRTDYLFTVLFHVKHLHVAAERVSCPFKPDKYLMGYTTRPTPDQAATN